MTETVKIDIERVLESRITKTDFGHLPFGKVYTDHMFMADFKDGEWKNARIIPYGYMPVSPASPAIHYGQSIFEGIKAYKSPKNEILVFRPLDNLRRMN